MVVREEGFAGAAELRGDHDVGRLIALWPVYGIDLRQGRDRDRSRHVLLLDRRVPPHLDPGRDALLRVRSLAGARRDGVDHGFVRVRVAARLCECGRIDHAGVLNVILRDIIESRGLLYGLHGREAGHFC